MIGSVYKTPQVHILGKIADAENFEGTAVYAKYRFLTGDSWMLLSGSATGETFISEVNKELRAPLEHPFDLNYSAKTIRGWPRLFIEVWQVDSSKRESIAGYGVAAVPMKKGSGEIKIYCWRPATSFWDKLLGTYPELEFKDIVISSQNRYGFKTESTGTVTIQYELIFKDFHLHGVQVDST